MVGEPHGDFGDLGGVFVDFDAVELADVGLQHGGDVEQLACGKQFADDVVFQPPQFAVGDDEEVAAAAGGVEELQAADFLVQFVDGGGAFGFARYFQAA